MITGIEVTSRAPLAGGAEFGSAGAYERIEGIATGRLDPLHPANRGIALLAEAPRDAGGMVAYRTHFILLRPARGNGRLLYEVNNRGRIMMMANLCAGAAGNRWQTAAELGNAMPLRMGFSLLWSGWDAGAPAATGLALEVPVIGGMRWPVREEFVSGTRLGVHETFRLTHDAAVREAVVTVRRTRDAAPQAVAAEFADARTVRLLPDGTKPQTGSIYEVRYEATNPSVQGIGFAATRDLVSHLRRSDLAGSVTHTLAFGISQAGRYLRDHIVQGFNADEDGRRVFDGVFTHVAGVGRVFHNAPFAQPFRTRTWHEDHDFPEVAFPFSATPMTDPLTGAAGGLMTGLPADPLMIETNTPTEYWQKGASLLHTDPLGRRDVALPANVRGYLIAGTQHGGRAGSPRDAGPCIRPRNWHDPMPAVRALLVALDRWVVSGTEPPPSCLPRIADGTLAAAADVTLPAIVGRPRAANDVAPLPDWTDPRPATARYGALVPQVDADGNEIAGIRLPDLAAPLGTFTGWNLYAAPYPAGELADRDGTFLAFAATRAQREAAGDTRLSLEERYATQPQAERRRDAAAALVRERLLLAEDAAAFRART